jgi:hypothetical protein
MTRPFTFAELVKCARRELAQRRRVYFRLVSQGKMDPQDAEDEMLMMEAIAEFFEGKTQPKLFPE